MNERFRELLGSKSLPRKVATFVLSAGAALIMACSTSDQPNMEELPEPTATADSMFPRPHPFSITESERAQEIVSQIQQILRPQFREINLTEKIIYPSMPGAAKMDVWLGRVGAESSMSLMVYDTSSDYSTMGKEGVVFKLKQTHLHFGLSDFTFSEDSRLKLLVSNINRGNGSWDTLVQTTSLIFQMPPGVCWNYYPNLKNIETGRIESAELQANGFLDDDYVFTYRIGVGSNILITLQELGVGMKGFRPRGTAIPCEDSRSRLERRLQSGFVIVN